MPIFEIEDPQTKKIYEIDSPQMPNAAQVRSILTKMGGAPPQAPTSPQQPQPGLIQRGINAVQQRVQQRSGIPNGANLDEIAAAVERGENARIRGNADYLPAAGGAVGGVMGGIPGAVVGGVAGEAARQSVLRSQNDPSAPQGVPAQAAEMGKSGAIQGVAQAGGQVIAGGGAMLSKWLMNRATTRVTERLMRDFPNLSDTLIDNALTVSKGGYARAQQMLQVAKAKATVALTRAEKAGEVVPIEFTTDIADSFRTALIEQAVKAGQTPLKVGEALTMATRRLPKPLQDLIAKIESVADGGVFDLTPKHADLLKSQLQKESRALYANRNAPNGPKATEAEATMKAEFAARLNDAIDLVADGYRAANKQAQPLIGAVRGIKQAIRPSGNLYQAMVRPAVGAILGGAAGQQQGNATAGALVGAAAMSPSNMSRMAITLGNPIVQQLLQQLPRGVAEAIEAHLGPGSSETTAPPSPGR